jgi:hypothetical protein
MYVCEGCTLIQTANGLKLTNADEEHRDVLT